MKPNKENIKKWVDALRSGKYRQGSGKLYNGSTFCCLGVACEVALENGVPLVKAPSKRVNSTPCYEYDGAAYSLPKSVQNWLGLDQTCPTIVKNGERKDAIQMNDEDQQPFSVIAACIQGTYLSV